MTLKRSVIREVKEQPMNLPAVDGCWVHDTRERACDMCERNANPTRYPENDAGILAYRADELSVVAAMVEHYDPNISDDIARAVSAIRFVAMRLEKVLGSESVSPTPEGP